jgi:hypothetical protein
VRRLDCVHLRHHALQDTQTSQHKTRQVNTNKRPSEGKAGKRQAQDRHHKTPQKENHTARQSQDNRKTIARQDKARQDKTRKKKDEINKTTQDKTREDKRRQDKTRQDKTRHNKTRQDITRQDKTNKTRQDRTGQDNPKKSRSQAQKTIFRYSQGNRNINHTKLARISNQKTRQENRNKRKGTDNHKDKTNTRQGKAVSSSSINPEKRTHKT